MWSDDRDHAAGAEDEPAAFCLLDGIGCLLLYLGNISKDDGFLADATAENRGDFRILYYFGSPGLSQARESFAVMPVDDQR